MFYSSTTLLLIMSQSCFFFVLKIYRVLGCQKQHLLNKMLLFACFFIIIIFSLVFFNLYFLCSVAQVSLARKAVLDELVQKRCREALELMHSAWQRSDSLHRGRCSREPWCWGTDSVLSGITASQILPRGLNIRMGADRSAQVIKDLLQT